MSISTDAIARWWGQSPEHRSLGTEDARIDVAIWAGTPREIWAEPDASTHLFAMPLNTYGCEVHPDGKLLPKTEWRRGEFQTMVAGAVPRATLTSGWRMMHIYLPDALIATVAADLGVTGHVELFDQEGARDPQLERLVNSLEAELTSGLAPSALLIDSYGIQIAAALIRRWSSAARVAPRQHAHGEFGGDWRLRRVIEYLEARLADDVRLAELAAAAGITTSLLTTLFRAGTGESPHRWLMRRRFERACAMLADPRVTITEVAHACGFASSQHLATVFRQRLGITPSAYRRERLS